MANPNLVASAPPHPIFIDKLNISGIEIMILNLPLQINGRQSTGHTASVEEVDLHRRGLAAT
jgi:hypothetical protein